ncbi:DMT family transporter [Halocatena salina]|uniref:EamA family transporter n=1 Tax=Halocatena salina TaxID=2934340 RepID=A0A8U0A3N0_9EURY|nr:EamA family transporter [Halocatena salina]UPM43801.1 EamA family transporter [Halocatena salina]
MRYRNLILFLVLAVLWGSAFMAIKVGVEYFPPVLFAALRYDIAGVLMLGYAWYVLDDPVPRTRSEWHLVAIGAVFLIGAYHALLFIGETDPGVTSATAAIVVSLSPVLTTAFARLMLPSERLGTLGLSGLILGFLGVIVLARPNPSNLFASDVVATFLIFIAALSFALGSVLTRRSDATLPIESLEAWSMLGGAVLMHAASVGLGESLQAITITTEAILALGYLSVFASAIGFLIYFSLLDRLGPIEINLVSYTAPPVAAVTGFLALGEHITLTTIAGFGVVMVGFALIKRNAIRQELPIFDSEHAGPADD